MALAAAIDVVVVLRLARVRPGMARAGAALASTALRPRSANWWIAAGEIGAAWPDAVGLEPAPRPRLYLTLATLANNHPADSHGSVAALVGRRDRGTLTEPARDSACWTASAAYVFQDCRFLPATMETFGGRTQVTEMHRKKRNGWSYHQNLRATIRTKL